MPKAKFPETPLSHPRTPIHRLAAGVRERLHMPEPLSLYALMGALTANYSPGPPVWLILVGPPSSGKSELLSALHDLPDVHPAGHVTSVGALISGARRHGARATGGLLRRVGSFGIVVLKEFGSILSMNRDRQREILGAFREIHDGSWTRDVGVDGGRVEQWEGKMGLLIGSTEALWSHYAVISELGERFLYFRSETSDGWTECRRAFSNPVETASAIRDLMLAFVSEVPLTRDSPLELPPLSNEDEIRLIAFASITARARVHISRDSYTREIDAPSTPEYPVRLALALGRMLQSMRRIGVGDDDSWRIIRKMAFDSVPAARRSALCSIADGLETVPQLSEAARLSQATMRRALEELRLHDVISQIDGRWRFSRWMTDRLREAHPGARLSIVSRSVEG